MCIRDRFSAVIDLSLPTNNGITICGKTTISLKGNNAELNLTSIFNYMDIKLKNAIVFYCLLSAILRS